MMKIKNYLDKFSSLNFQLSTPRGFTLIELLIAIAMIGVLSIAGMAVLNPLDQIKKGRDAQRKNDLLQIRNALDAYNSDNNVYPSSSNNKIRDDKLNQVVNWGDSWQPYILKLPKDPLSPQQNYYYVSEDKTSYTVYAKLERSNDPQIIPGSASSPYNFAISSTNIAVALLPTPTPTITPTPTPTATPTPTLTPTPTPTPTLSPKRVFVTSQTYNGDLKTAGGSSTSGLDGADRLCQGRAGVAGLGGTWIAWLSTDTVNAKDRISDGIYKRMDLAVIANNKADLLDGSIANDISINENGNPVNSSTNEFVWTGTLTDGTGSYNLCTSWRNGFNGPSGKVGYIPVSSAQPATNYRWTNYVDYLCGATLRLYCFEQ